LSGLSEVGADVGGADDEAETEGLDSVTGTASARTRRASRLPLALRLPLASEAGEREPEAERVPAPDPEADNAAELAVDGAEECGVRTGVGGGGLNASYVCAS